MVGSLNTPIDMGQNVQGGPVHTFSSHL
jgi:hypothetical protein